MLRSSPLKPPLRIPKSHRLVSVSALIVSSRSLLSPSLAQPITLVSLVSPSLSGHRPQIPNPQQVSRLALSLSTLSLWSFRLLLNQSLWSLWSIRLSPITAPQIPNPQQVDRLRLLLSTLSLGLSVSCSLLLLTALRSLSGHRSPLTALCSHRDVCYQWLAGSNISFLSLRVLQEPKYFDQYGIIERHNTSHILRTIALVFHGTPVSLEDEDIRNEKVKVLRSIRKLSRVMLFLVKYKDSSMKKGEIYLNTLTPTFFAVALYIDNARWDGVPFMIKAGMGLIKHIIDLATNELILRDVPDEAILVKVNNKIPGLGAAVGCFRIEFVYKEKYNEEIPDSYKHLLLDAKLQRRRQELTQTTLDQPVDDEAVYYKVAGDCPKGCVYSLRSLWRKKRRYVDPDASTSQMLAQRGMGNFMILNNGNTFPLLIESATTILETE
ncbi:hypothetical protein Syun_012383 [Stephania yunnanensis]|uniref:Glucose-6-phosphate dehydrogenase C-terminal domain-containing protein n=1 Tax=Stephania yunnanensis TaxID=152371 RepID=A0AAP0K0Q5_9MAGN